MTQTKLIFVDNIVTFETVPVLYLMLFNRDFKSRGSAS